MLGRPYTVSGVVVRGDSRGRTLGYPTANVDYDIRKRLPADGVYAARVRSAAANHAAVVNVGVRPTFAAVGRTLEAHLLDFKGDFVARVRGETRFSSADELVAQLGRDVERAQEWLQTESEVEPVAWV